MKERFQSMLNRLQDVATIARAQTQEKRAMNKELSFESQGPELAYAVILLDLVGIDHVVKEEELEVFRRLLGERFGFSDGETSQLIEHSRKLLSGGRGGLSFAERLAGSLPLDERRKLLSMIDQIIGADGVTDDMEVYLRGRYVKALGLEKK